MVGRELLNGGDDDARTVVDCFLKLAGSTVNFLDDAFRLFELRHSVLKLSIEDYAISHNDRRIEYWLIGRVMQVDGLVRGPADGIGFAGPCRMLNEVVAARPEAARVCHHLPHRIK